MPYIDADDRADLEPEAQRQALTVGELTFQLTALCDDYMSAGEGLDFQAIAEVRGALWSTLVEIDRRIAAPYEDIKLAINGDVFMTQVRDPRQRRKIVDAPQS